MYGYNAAVGNLLWLNSRISITLHHLLHRSTTLQIWQRVRASTGFNFLIFRALSFSIYSLSFFNCPTHLYGLRMYLSCSKRVFPFDFSPFWSCSEFTGLSITRSFGCTAAAFICLWRLVPIHSFGPLSPSPSDCLNWHLPQFSLTAECRHFVHAHSDLLANFNSCYCSNYYSYASVSFGPGKLFVGSFLVPHQRLHTYILHFHLFCCALYIH